MKAKNIRHFLILLFGIWFICIKSSIGYGQASAVVKVDPALIGLKPGDTVQFTVQVEGVEELYGAEIHLLFDPAVIEILDADQNIEQAQCRAGDIWSEGFTAVNKADNSTGRFDFAATLLNPASPFQGSGVIVQCEARGKSIGKSGLNLENIILATRQGAQIAFTLQNGQAEVSTSGKISSGEGSNQPSQGEEEQSKIEGGASSGEEVSGLLIGIAIAAVILLIIAVVLVFRTSRKRRE